MKKHFFVLIGLMVFLCCCKNDNEQSCYSNTNSQNIVIDGINREYVLYVPSSYDGATEVPLMLNFHGFGGSASEFMLEADMRSLAESDTFILIYPQGSCLNGSSHWNACPIGGDNKSNADDFSFIESIINEVSSQYNINTECIYAAGYSNGGMMAYGLANYRSELIAAVASVSGAMLDCTGQTSHPMPVIHLHGTSDDVIPYDGNSDYNSVESTLNHWTNFNNTVSSPTITTDNTGGISIEQYIYSQGDSLVSIEHYKYLGGEHIWFNSTFQGSSTSRLIWDFLSKYDINGLK